VVLVHGLGEHIMRYNEYIQLFCNKGIAFVGFDHPGHGKSEGKRGTIISYKQLLDNISIVLNFAKATIGNMPVFIYGHSMGGNITANYMLNRNGFKGIILSSPWLKLTSQPSKPAQAIVSILSKFVPNLTISNGLDANWISTQKEMVEKYKTDVLVHERISLRLLSNIIKQGDWALKNIENLNAPCLILHGTADKITSPKASEAMAKNKPDKVTYVPFEGKFHELQNEDIREALAKNCIAFIENQIKS
jgi:alpha-beta hydrolase superfamily lysophospholipase